jgi:Tfp pilus assembly protein PilX
MRPVQARHRKQHGSTLLVSMIMLLLITMLAFTSFRLASGNLKIVGNMQQRNQVLAAAQGAIEKVVSNPLFSATPGKALPTLSSADLPTPCVATPNTTCIDVNGDGATDITVRVGGLRPDGSYAPCVQQVKPVANASLDLSRPEDSSCSVGVGQTYGVEGANSGNSMCTDMLWEVLAEATDTQAGASAAVTAGIRVRSSNDDANATYHCN